jgi:hypothetical protein
MRNLLTGDFLISLGFIKDGYTNLSYDYYLEQKEFSIFINLRSTCDKRAEIFVINKIDKKEVSIKEGRRYDGKHLGFTIEDLKASIKLAGIEFER